MRWGTRQRGGRLLAERAGLAWVAFHVAELVAAHGQHTLGHRNYHLRRCESCNRRFLSAVRSLAQVRAARAGAGAATARVRVSPDGTVTAKAEAVAG